MVCARSVSEEREFRAPRWTGIVAAACFAGALLSALVVGGAAAGRDLAMRRAVVVALAVPAREGPAERSVSRFEIHEGTTVGIEDEEAGFRRVKLANDITYRRLVANSSLHLVRHQQYPCDESLPSYSDSSLSA